jgi:hypothetical protein
MSEVGYAVDQARDELVLTPKVVNVLGGIASPVITTVFTYNEFEINGKCTCVCH